MYKAWKWVLDQFLHQKLITFSSICSLGKQSISKTDKCMDRPLKALPSAYQEYLVALNWCRCKWYKEYDQLCTGIYAWIVL